jgi:hypothetical protein
LEYKEVESDCFRQLVLDEAEEAETEVANVDTERRLWLLYRVNVLVEVFVLAIEFRQLFDAAELEIPDTGRPLVGDAARRDCDCSSPLPRAVVSTTAEGDTGKGGDCNCVGIWTEDGSSAMITFDTFVARAEPEFD